MSTSLAAACAAGCVATPVLQQRVRAVPTAPAHTHLAFYAAKQRRLSATTAAAKPADEVEPVPPALLSQLSSDDELAEEAQWVSSMVECWLNEEWPAAELLEVHATLGEVTGQAYYKLRQQAGMEEMGDMVLALASELLVFDYKETFVNAFDVSNKVIELLMLRSGCDVCCTSESDRTAITRYEAQLAASRAEQQS